MICPKFSCFYTLTLTFDTLMLVNGIHFAYVCFAFTVTQNYFNNFNFVCELLLELSCPQTVTIT